MMNKNENKIGILIFNFKTQNWIIKAVKNKKVILEAENREAGRKGRSSFLLLLS